jgi:hypothetical protein
LSARYASSNALQINIGTPKINPDAAIHPTLSITMATACSPISSGPKRIAPQTATKPAARRPGFMAKGSANCGPASLARTLEPAMDGSPLPEPVHGNDLCTEHNPFDSRRHLLGMMCVRRDA